MDAQIVFLRHRIVAKQQPSLAVTVFIVSASSNPEEEWQRTKEQIARRLVFLSQQTGCELIVESSPHKADVLFHISRKVVEDQSQCNGIGVYPGADYDIMYAHIAERFFDYAYS